MFPPGTGNGALLLSPLPTPPVSPGELVVTVVVIPPCPVVVYTLAPESEVVPLSSIPASLVVWGTVEVHVVREPC